MSKIVEEVSEEDAEEYHSSGEEWVSKSPEKKRATRRTSQRLRKKPRISVNMTNSSDSDSEKNTSKKKKTKAKKPKKQALPVGMNIINKDFMPGGFVVLKKDVQIGDTSRPPCLWRIDGKALLQKYETFDEQGKTLHRSTSIYTGWSPLDKDLYAPVTVKVQWHISQQMIVELNWETLKNATMDSD
ncbi:uncharacterized protein CBL_03370 [Carabus blaptoides fortunei]